MKTIPMLIIMMSGVALVSINKWYFAFPVSIALAILGQFIDEYLNHI